MYIMLSRLGGAAGVRGGGGRLIFQYGISYHQNSTFFTNISSGIRNRGVIPCYFGEKRVKIPPPFRPEYPIPYLEAFETFNILPNV